MHNDPKACLAALEARCAAAGIPVTSQRRTVLEVLVTRDDHPTVDQIFGAVSARMPDISRATVYRTLETLGELDLLRPVEHPGSAVRYDGNMQPHHHFLCVRCGALEDLPLDAVRGHEGLEFVAPQGRSARDISVTVRGLCGHCA